MEKIEVVYKPVVAGTYHKFIRYTDSNGNQYATRVVSNNKSINIGNAYGCFIKA